MEQEYGEKEFIAFLKQQNEIIKTNPFSRKQILNLINLFQSFIEQWTRRHGKFSKENVERLNEAACEFFLAIEISESNFRKENKSFWTDIFGFAASKLPSLDTFLKK